MRLVLPIILLLLLLTDIPLFAQTGGKIAGVVKDSRTGELLIGANVVVEGTKMGAASNAEGYYVILNVPPGTYSLRATLIGYNATTLKGVRVNIDQTTSADIALTETSLQTAEVVVVAQTPVVQKDVAASRLNLSGKEMENLPVAQVSNMVGLQAGVQGGSFRGGSADQTTWLLNGVTLRDERSNQPYTGLSTTAIEEVQVQTGGFSAEYGNIRSGLVNVVTKEGKTDRFGISFYSRYRPTGPKHFGNSPQDKNAFWIRPFVDDQVAWVGTEKGWKDDPYLQAQYPTFEGWNAASARMFQENPSTALTPQELQKLYLFQHRKNTDITKPDYDVDLSVTGYFPGVSQHLGNLRFLAAYRGTREMYIVPLSRDAYTDNNFQLKLTADLAQGMKLNLEGLVGQQEGTSTSGTGDVGMFRSPAGIAYQLSNFSNAKTIENRIFTYDYFTPSKVNVNNIGAKLTHVLNPNTFYEVTLSRFQSRYDTSPGRLRDTSRIYKFGNSYVDEGPYGFWEAPTTGIQEFRMSVGFSNSRDTSKVTAYNLKFDLTSQLNKYNNLKAGFEFGYSENLANYGSYDKFLPSGRYRTTWNAYPTRGAVYVKDKLEFEGMIADVGLRVDYSSANEKWYNINNPFSDAFSAEKSPGIDTLLTKQPTKANVTVSPRVAIAFPLSETSKLFFNYGHFRQLPTPTNLYLLRRLTDNKAVVWVANPNNPLPRTIMYELGYEQSFFEEYLVRLSGYYKDVSLQPMSVAYVSRNGSTNYSTPEPNSYADIRGFEATITKNRGNWVQGFVNYTYMVSTSGRFGFALYNEAPKDQRDYETQILNNYNLISKPVPQPYARANVDFFTPVEFGPKLGGIYPLEDWRLSVLASWSAGDYFTWTGGGSIPGVQNNVQWKDYYGFDLKIAKNFKFGPLDMQLFADIRNALNIKYMDYFGAQAGFADSKDYEAYMKSLHLPKSAFENIRDNEGNIKAPYENTNVPGLYIYGDDRPGDYRTGEYHAWDESATDAQKAEWKKNKSYIDMPNQDYFTFLNPRDIYWGLRFSLEIF